ASERKEFYPVLKSRLRTKPGCRIGLRIKQVRYLGPRKTRWECVHRPSIKPVVECRIGLLRVEPNPGVAQPGISGYSSQENHSGPSIDCLRSRLLVASISEWRLPGCPRVARVDIEVTQEREHAVSTVDTGDIPKQQINHATPVVLRNPVAI